jgi:DedD protein
MEKKKLLLVAISVGIFLALTIGAAILVFSPKDVPAASMAAVKSVGAVDTGITMPSPSSASPSGSSAAARQDSSPQPSSVDPVELVRQPNDVPGLRQAPEGAGRQGDDFYVSGNGGASGRGAETVISVPKPSTAAVPDAPPAGRAASTQVQTAPKPAAPASQTQTKPAATQTQTNPVATQPQTKPTATQTQAKPASAQTQTKPAVTQTKVYNDYWVQTGAFSTIARAEGVKATLSSRGITSIIENREVEGRTVFRVRVGPYTSQNEANYWLSLIKSINGFEDSQVRQTQSSR